MPACSERRVSTIAIQLQGYEQRVATPSAGGTPQLRAVNRPVVDVSGEISQLTRVYEKVEDDTAETEAMKAVAATRMSVEEMYRGAQEKAAPGADQFTPTFMGEYDGAVTKAADALPSELSRKKFNEKMLGFGVGLQERAIGWEADQRRSERRRSFEEAADNHASTLFSTDAGNREPSFDLMRGEIEQSLATVDLPPDAKADLREKIKTKMSYAAVQGDLRDRPEAVQDWLVKGGGAGYYSKLRSVESGGRNIGSDTSSAFGPYQFTAGTWDTLAAKHPELGLTKKDRFDPTSQEVAIRAFTDDNAKTLKAAGLPATNVNLYMMHFLGEGGGPRFVQAVIKNGDDDARLHVDRAQAAANPGIFKPGRTVKDVYLLFGQKFGATEDVKQAGGSPTYYNDLSFAHRNTLYDQADAELRKRRTEGAAAFGQVVQNTVAQYASQGFSQESLGEQQFVAAYGLNRGAVAYGEFQAATIGAKAGHDLKTLDLAQHGQYLESIRPDENDPFFAEKLKGFEAAKQVSNTVRGAVKEDAAGYVAGYNPAIGQQLAAISDMEASDDATRKGAVQAYLATLNQEYDRLGVPSGMRRTVPKSYAENVGTMLQTKLTSDAGATQIVGLTNKIAASWGAEWPRVYADISDKLSAPLKVITSGIDPRAATVLASVANQSFEDLAKVFPKATKSDLQTNLQAEFEPFIRSTGFQASALGNVNTFYEQGTKLAAVYVAQGESASGAAEKAYNDLIGFKYKMVDDRQMNVRLPKPAQAPGMEEAIRHERELILIDGPVMLGANPDGAPLTDEERAERTRPWLMRNAKWVTQPDDSGVILVVGTQAWSTGKRLPNGKMEPIQRSWAEIAARRDILAEERENLPSWPNWSD